MIERVDDFIFRGSKPVACFELEPHEITVVIDLREPNEQPFNQYDCQDRVGKGIKVFSIPMNGHKPTPYQINQFIRAIWYCLNNKKNCLIHCQYGKDRTGFMTAIYRIYFNNWPAKQAIDEMLMHGFNRLLFHSWIKVLEQFTLTKDTPMYAKWGEANEF